MNIKTIVLAGILPMAVVAGQAQGATAQGATPQGNSRPVAVGSAQQAKAYARYDRGPVAAEKPMRRMKVVLRQSAARRAALERLIAEQQNPQSGNYRLWLSPEEFAARFGADAADAARVAAWLESEGMTDVEVARGRLQVSFSGTAGAVSSAFRTAIDTFDVDGARHFANVVAPSVPSNLAGLISDVVGLHDFNPVPQVVHAARAAYVTGGGANALGPDDLAAVYDIGPLYARGIDGSGIVVAVLGQTPIGLGDYRAYRQKFSLPANDFQIAAVPGSGSGTNRSIDQEEATLDVEAMGAVARNAAIVYVWGDSVIDAAQYVVDNRLAQVMSLSYAGAENSAAVYYQDIAMQANAEGITWVSSAGDSGAAGWDATGSAAAANGLSVMSPASVPQVTAVGGTAFTDGTSSQYWNPANNAQGGSALGYIPETGWSSTNAVIGGGGGVSTQFVKPGFQSDFDTAVTSGRMVPDVALAAAVSPVPYAMVFNGSVELVGGTSASTPVFGGITALVNHYLVANGSMAQPGLGNVNPNLYLLAEQIPSAFHDVSAGSNDVPCTVGMIDCATGTLGYPATAGYDEATGLGSVDAYVLASNWSNGKFAQPAVTLSASTAQIEVTQSVTLRATVTVDGTPLAHSPVAFSDVRVLAQSTAAPVILGYAVTDEAGVASISTDVIPAGTNDLTAASDGATTVSASANSNTVVVTATAFPTTIMLAATQGTAQGTVLTGSKLTFTATVTDAVGAPVTGPNGPSDFYQQGTVTLYAVDGTWVSSTILPSTGIATLTSNALVSGANSFYAIYSGNDYGAASESAVATVTAVNPVAGDFAITGPNAVTLAAGSSASVSLSITPTGAFSGIVSLSCAGLPAGYTCTVPGTIAVQGATTVAVSLASTSAAVLVAGIPFALFGVLLTGGAARRKRRAALVVLGLALGCLTACGGGAVAISSTSSSTRTALATVTATSGSVTHTFAIDVTMGQ